MIKKDTLKKECTVIGEFSQPLTTEDVIPLKNFNFLEIQGKQTLSKLIFILYKKRAKPPKPSQRRPLNPL